MKIKFITNKKATINSFEGTLWRYITFGSDKEESVIKEGLQVKYIWT